MKQRNGSERRGLESRPCLDRLLTELNGSGLGLTEQPSKPTDAMQQAYKKTVWIVVQGWDAEHSNTDVREES